MTSSPTLICIDDSQLVQSLISRELENYDVQLHFANDGIEGLDCCMRETPDLVMLDLRMPSMDGIEFLKKWKTELSYADTRFIIMTSETSREIVEEVLSLGISDYIAKPFSGKTILSRIAQHVPLKKREKFSRISPAPNSFPSQPRVPAMDAIHTRTAIHSGASITLGTIRVLTRRMEADQREISNEENSLQEVIAKYQVILGAKNAYLTSLLAELLKEGKVCVETDMFSERIQLKNSENKIDAPTAARLLARYFEEQGSEVQMGSSFTQRIILKRPPKIIGLKNSK